MPLIHIISMYKKNYQFYQHVCNGSIDRISWWVKLAVRCLLLHIHLAEDFVRKLTEM